MFNAETGNIIDDDDDRGYHAHFETIPINSASKLAPTTCTQAAKEKVKKKCNIHNACIIRHLACNPT
jgi:hypothetical protein